jgi:hypothetical protein
MERDRPGRFSVRDAWREGGWRRSALLFAFTSMLAFVANLSFSIWAVTRPNIVDGVGTVTERNCTDIRRLNTGLHVLINALSTVLLSGSNYCMQCLSSPTRAQIDGAHRNRFFMDVGVSSIRNLFSFEASGRRLLLWFLLAVSSLPLHLL